jgi:hypothetical protein
MKYKEFYNEYFTQYDMNGRYRDNQRSLVINIKYGTENVVIKRPAEKTDGRDLAEDEKTGTKKSLSGIGFIKIIFGICIALHDFIIEFNPRHYENKST